MVNTDNFHNRELAKEVGRMVNVGTGIALGMGAVAAFLFGVWTVINIFAAAIDGPLGQVAGWSVVITVWLILALSLARALFRGEDERHPSPPIEGRNNTPRPLSSFQS